MSLKHELKPHLAQPEPIVAFCTTFNQQGTNVVPFPDFNQDSANFGLPNLIPSLEGGQNQTYVIDPSLAYNDDVSAVGSIGLEKNLVDFPQVSIVKEPIFEEYDGNVPPTAISYQTTEFVLFDDVRKLQMSLSDESKLDESNIQNVLDLIEQQSYEFTPLQWHFLGEYATYGATKFRARLAQALLALGEVKLEAEEEEYKIPTEVAIGNADFLLRKLIDIFPLTFEIYPMPDGEIAIDMPNGNGSSVMILCESDGSVLCLVNIKGSSRRARYSYSKALPDGFVREALEELIH